MVNRLLIVALMLLVSTTARSQTNGMPATDVLGSADLAGNPTFIGGVANGGSTSHGIW